MFVRWRYYVKMFDKILFNFMIMNKKEFLQGIKTVLLASGCTLEELAAEMGIAISQGELAVNPKRPDAYDSSGNYKLEVLYQTPDGVLKTIEVLKKWQAIGVVFGGYVILKEAAPVSMTLDNALKFCKRKGVMLGNRIFWDEFINSGIYVIVNAILTEINGAPIDAFEGQWTSSTRKKRDVADVFYLHEGKIKEEDTQGHRQFRMIKRLV